MKAKQIAISVTAVSQAVFEKQMENARAYAAQMLADLEKPIFNELIAFEKSKS